MTCEEARGLLQAFVDGELEPQARDAVQAHIRGCAECEQEARRYSELVALLRNQPIEAPPRDLVPEVMGKIKAAQALSIRRMVTKFIAVAACLVLALVVGYLAMSRAKPAGPANPPQEVSVNHPVPDINADLSRVWDSLAAFWTPTHDCSQDFLAGVAWVAAPVTSYINDTLQLEAEEPARKT